MSTDVHSADEVDPDASVGVTGRVRLRGWEVEDLRHHIPQWDRRLKRRRHAFLMSDLLEVDPVFEATETNLILDNYLDILARGEAVYPSHLALGDGTTAPAAGNDSLNNEVYRPQVGQNVKDGHDRITSTFVSQNEANGEAIREVGLTNGRTDENWTLLTHVVLDDADQVDEKTSRIALTIDYVLEFRRL